MIPSGTAADPGLPPFYSLVALDSGDSTNAAAARRAAAGAPEGTLVWARSQTAGRGRRGRTWQSPPGNLYVSLVLRPDCPLEQAAQLSFVAAVALGEAVDAVLPRGPALRFKWPNDLLLDGAKVSGILLEAATDAGALQSVVIGIGVNIASAPPAASDSAETASGAGYPATSLAAAGSIVTAPVLLQGLAGALLAWRERWSRQGFAPVRAQWLRFARGPGETVTVRLPGETLHGRFEALEADGAMVLALADGRTRRVTAGDVFFGAAPGAYAGAIMD
jgi:BirA family biotin operon repressor/biotin-[acetyl-CoA-carboxylase] ligase